MNICIHTHIHIHIYRNLRITLPFFYVHMLILRRTYICAHIHTHLHTYTYTYAETCGSCCPFHLHAYIYSHTYTHTCIYTYAYTHIQKLADRAVLFICIHTGFEKNDGPLRYEKWELDGPHKVCVHTYTYIHVYIHIHTFLCTCMYVFVCGVHTMAHCDTKNGNLMALMRYVCTCMCT